MAFPTTSIIDNFNRASIGANWTNDINGIAITGSTVAIGTTGSDINIATYNVAQIGPAFEVYITRANDADNSGIQLISDPINGDGYEVLALNTGSLFYINRNDDWVSTRLGASESITWGSGDKYGVYTNGTGTWKIYQCPSGGSWGQVGADRTDSTYTPTCYPSLFIQSNVQTLDDFGGGTVTEPTGHPTIKRWGGVPFVGLNRGVW